MTETRIVTLESRAVLAVAGADRRSFLQGLISNDVNKATQDHAVHAAFLTAQGRFLHEFFVVELGDRLLLDTEAARLDDLLKRLSAYRLRAKVTLTPLRDEFAVIAAFGAGCIEAFRLAQVAGAAAPYLGGVAFVDPRLPELGVRALLPRAAIAELGSAGFSPASFTEYDAWRLSLGVPDGSRDLKIERALLLENGFDELNGVDWKKGCYVGQEVTARMKYRALVKRQLMLVRIDGPIPAPGTPITLNDTKAGEMRSALGDRGLALIHTDRLAELAEQGGEFIAGEARLKISTPAWRAAEQD